MLHQQNQINMFVTTTQRNSGYTSTQMAEEIMTVTIAAPSIMSLLVQSELQRIFADWTASCAVSLTQKPAMHKITDEAERTRKRSAKPHCRQQRAVNKLTAHQRSMHSTWNA